MGFLANQVENSSASRLRVLVVEREARVRLALSRCLEALGCELASTDLVKDALAAVEHRTFDLAFVDPALEIEPGHDLGSRLLDERPEMTLVLIVSCTPFGAVLSERLRGACDHLPEAFTPGQIRRLVERSREQRNLRQRLADCQRRLRRSSVDSGVVAESAAMRATLAAAAGAAAATSPIVLCGEPGTGHERLARFIHQHGNQSRGPFVAADLIGSADEDVAAQLFGGGRDSAPGRCDGFPGLVEEADGGTLFLRKLRDFPSRLQAPLQRLIQQNDFERLGELRVRHATVRVVASIDSHAPWPEFLGGGAPVVRIAIPPLRDRVPDIVPLARTFVDAFSRTRRRDALVLTEEAQQALVTYDWPGNVAELKNAVERAVLLCRTEEIGVGDLPEGISSKSSGAPRLGGDFTIAEIEREHMRRVAGRAANDLAAAKVLGISRSTLWRRRDFSGRSLPPR